MQSKRERFRHFRRLLGMTQEEFGNELGLSRGAVANWEKRTSGGGISGENRDKLLRLAGPYFDWLISGKGEPPKSLDDLRGSGGITKVVSGPSISPAEGDLASLVESVAEATLDLAAYPKDASLRRYLKLAVLAKLLDEPGAPYPLPVEMRDRLLHEVGGFEFLEKVRSVLPLQMTSTRPHG